MRRVFLVLMAAALAGCGMFHHEVANASPSVRQTRIEWLGYESFQLTSSFGLGVVTNPFDSSVGTMQKGLRPEVLLITTEQPAFDNDDAMENTPLTFRGAIGVGMNSASGIRLRGVPTYIDPAKESGMNLVFCWSMDGLRICFAGNIQAPLSSYNLSLVGGVDVLFLPIGIPSVLSDTERYQIVQQLHPRVIIPMGPKGAVESWAAAQPGLYRVGSSSVHLGPETLPVKQTVLLLNAP